MVKIKEGDWIAFDNGMVCLVSKSDDPNYDYFLNYWGWHLNYFKEYYLDDAIKYGQKVCVQRLNDGSLEYAKIVAVNGQLIKSKEMVY
jgi:hypothetical protein